MTGYDRRESERSQLVSDFHSIEMQSITGEPVALSNLENQVCLVVNVASE